ncbi:hypothetical protein BKI52_32985 [marine bacterium AO1-C]|nr:hypothetical protein BKI52_32985 [marine bacterium AO1-C]
MSKGNETEKIEENQAKESKTEKAVKDKMSYEELQKYCLRLESAYSLERMFPNAQGVGYRELNKRVEALEQEHAPMQDKPLENDYEELRLEVESLKKSKAKDVFLSLLLIGLQALLLWTELKKGK